MLKEPVIQVQSVTTGMVDGVFTIIIKIYNPDTRTLYAYASPRRFQYDQATKTLTISFHDQHIDEDSQLGKHLLEPKIITIEGKTEEEIRVKFPQGLKRLKSATETGGEAEVEEIHPEEATSITVEIAHQDTPFYYNPKNNNAAQLKHWGNVIVRKNHPMQGPQQGKTPGNRR